MKIDLYNIDRRIIYFLVLISLTVPLLLHVSVKPVRMIPAEKMYDVVENLKVSSGDFAIVALDFGPNSMAENKPQAEAVIEHLLRKRVPIAMYSQYMLAQTFLESIPLGVIKRLMRENPGQRWDYGRDWVDLGLQLNAPFSIQGLAKTEDIANYFKKDARGNSLRDLPLFANVHTIESIKLFVQFTSLTGTFESYIQFLKSEKFRPIFLHGCTSITIPKAYTYLDSGQIVGLLEGVAGAAWYSNLLTEKFPRRGKDDAITINTGLGFAQLLIIALIVFGNLMALSARGRR